MAIVEIVSSTGTVSVVDGTEIVVQSVELSVQPSIQVVEVLTGTQGPAGTPGSRSIAQDIASAPVGDVLSNNVQDAIAELSAEKSPRSLVRSFTQADLSIANILAITHNFGVYPASVTIWDNTSSVIQPDAINNVGVDSISVDFGAYSPIVGTYKIVISE